MLMSAVAQKTGPRIGWGRCWAYSLYAGLACLLSQLGHIWVYAARGGHELLTWRSSVIPISTGVWGAALFLLLSVVLSLRVLPPLYRQNPGRMLTLGMVYMLGMGTLSQVVFASMMRAAYEVSFYAVVVASVFVVRFFTSKEALSMKLQGTTHSQRLWHLARTLIPVSAAWPVAVLGISMIRDFYPGEPEVVRAQLYRHAIMAVLTVVGLLAFVILPILARIVECETGESDRGAEEASTTQVDQHDARQA